jgi:hypothetical protein
VAEKWDYKKKLTSKILKMKLHFPLVVISLSLLCMGSSSNAATTPRYNNRYYQTQTQLHSQKFENVTKTLNKLLENYDIRLRPKFGCM